MKRLSVLLILLWPFLFAGTVNVVVGQPLTPYVPTNYVNDANLQGCYLLENNINDSSGEGNNLEVLDGTAAYSTTTAVKEGTYSGDVDAYWSAVEYTPSASWPGQATYSGITVCGWINLSSNDSPHCIIATYKYNVNRCWQLYTTAAGKLEFRVWDSDDTVHTITGSTTLSTATNYFVAGVWDGSYLRLYLGTDSASPSSDATAVSWSGTPKSGVTYAALHAFAFVGDTTATMLGYTDEIAVFNRALSSSEISEIRAHGLNGSR